MDVLLLIVVLVALILVHELGHFVAAKIAGMRVLEFGIGYPPRAARIAKKGETEYTLNWLPFGGFVRIYGEDGEATGTNGRAFTDKNRFAQALVLVAGIAMNLLFAWVLISGSLLAGTPRALDPNEVAMAPDAHIIVSDILPGSPAETAGLLAGDTIVQSFSGEELFTAPDPAAFTEFIAQDGEEAPITFDILRGGEQLVLSVMPEKGIIASDPTRPAIGIAVAVVGTVPVSWYEAPVLGAEYTWSLVKATAVGLAHFFGSIFTLSADFSQVAGPVGIAGAVGVASDAGLTSLITLTAIISINLALINLIPVPALDGGRLLFVLIESVTRRRIKPAVAGAMNTIGFLLLILLMVVVTAHDIWKIVA